MNIEKQSLEGNVLSVLVYLFENHMHNGCKLDIDKNALLLELCQLGFQQEYIWKALDWLSELSLKQCDMQQYPPQQHSIRIFDINERLKLDQSCRNLLLRLENLKILNPLTRELIISQVMQLDVNAINVNQIKWVIMMVLFNQLDKNSVLNCMESLLLTDMLDNAQKI